MRFLAVIILFLLCGCATLPDHYQDVQIQKQRLLGGVASLPGCQSETAKHKSGATAEDTTAELRSATSLQPWTKIDSVEWQLRVTEYYMLKKYRTRIERREWFWNFVKDNDVTIRLCFHCSTIVNVERSKIGTIRYELCPECIEERFDEMEMPGLVKIEVEKELEIRRSVREYCERKS